MQAIHVRRGDLVGVISGRERGKRGKVLRVLTDKNRVVVEHVNMVKKHQRPTQKLRQGGIIEREGPLALSNVLPICGRCDKPARTGTTVLGDGRKVRTCRRCGEPIDKG
jgi:large subunit ribosomal protein L24